MSLAKQDEGLGEKQPRGTFAWLNIAPSFGVSLRCKGALVLSQWVEEVHGGVFLLWLRRSSGSLSTAYGMKDFSTGLPRPAARYYDAALGGIWPVSFGGHCSLLSIDTIRSERLG